MKLHKTGSGEMAMHCLPTTDLGVVQPMSPDQSSSVQLIGLSGDVLSTAWHCYLAHSVRSSNLPAVRL